MTSEERAFRRWLTGVARPYVGWLLIVVAAVLIFLCWYGVSGQTMTAQQLPYFASDGLAAVALVVVGAALIASGDLGRQRTRLDDIERKVGDLYTLLVEDGEPTTDATSSQADSQPSSESPTQAAGFVALPTGTSYHRPTCALVAGKPAVAVDAAAISARSLTPCRVCDPGEASPSG